MNVMTQQRLFEFADAWASQDLRLVLTFFTDDCVYKASAGAEPGATYSGKEQVAEGIKSMWQFDETVSSEIMGIVLCEKYGFWEWSYQLSNNETRKGCDFFKFEGDRIKEKNAFRKVHIVQ